MRFQLKFVALLLLVTFVTSSFSQVLLPNYREKESIEFSEDWLDLLENGKDQESYEQLSEIFRSNLSFETWAKLNRKTRNDLGALMTRKFKRTVVYENPNNAPLAGLYIAVEFDSVYENARKHFQYIILHSQNDEPFKVMRREANQLLND